MTVSDGRFIAEQKGVLVPMPDTSRQIWVFLADCLLRELEQVAHVPPVAFPARAVNAN